MKKEIKVQLHPQNKHRLQYDFKALIKSFPPLSPYVIQNKNKEQSIDFFIPKAVKALNTALLKHFYKIKFWDIPENYLCPAIPGRADYIHHIAELLSANNVDGKIPLGETIKCLDIGVGASCIYPIIGNHEYGWTFVGADINAEALKSAKVIVDSNPALAGNIDLRLQDFPKDIFRGIIKKDEVFDLSICNPPFHASLSEVQTASNRKLRNLHHKESINPVSNFAGQSSELFCEGGEQKFVNAMIYQSKFFANSCFWFSTLISKKSNLKRVYKTLEKIGVHEYKTIPMSQGNKVSRLVAWTFLNSEQQQEWIKERW